MLNPFKRLLYFYWHYMVSPERYARHIGVTIGKNCRIFTRNWSSEPYLVTIGIAMVVLLYIIVSGFTIEPISGGHLIIGSLLGHLYNRVD